MCACIEGVPYSKFDKERICAMPFAHKLWVVASLPHKNFIKWGPTGDSILLHLSDLDEYLRSLQSMFSDKDCNEFLISLRDHGFKLVRQDLVSLIEFQHKFFQRERLEYLCMIANEAPNCEPDKKTKERKAFDAEYRMSSDLCVMKHGCWTHLQFYQAKMKIAMEYNAAQFALKRAHEKRTTFGMPIPTEIFKQPAESILDLIRDENFFGYHGDIPLVLLERFYGDHKPLLQPTMPEYELLPPNVFNMNFLKPRPKDPQNNNMYHNQEPGLEMIKHENKLTDDFDAYSYNSDMMDDKQNDGSDDEIFEDDDDDIEPIEDPDEMEQNENENEHEHAHEQEQEQEQEQEHTADFFDQNWPNLSDFDEGPTNRELLDSLPDLNSFFDEEYFLNPTGMPFPTQSRFFNDR